MGLFNKKRMEEKEVFGSILRFVEDRNIKHADGEYKRKNRIKDDNTGKILAECDVYERAIYSELDMIDNHKQVWRIRPNRKIMPMRWYVYSPKGKKSSEIRLPGFLSMMYPFSRRGLRITELSSGRKLTLMDLESGFFDLIFGGRPLLLSVMENKKIIAKISYLPKKEEELKQPIKKGLFSRIKKWFKGSDWSLQSYGSEPVMEARTFLALSLVYHESTSGQVD